LGRRIQQRRSNGITGVGGVHQVGGLKLAEIDAVIVDHHAHVRADEFGAEPERVVATIFE